MYDVVNKYLANLAVLNVKFHNLHWNVVGSQFTTLHNFTEEAYDMFFEAYDDVAEILKMREHFPLGSMKDYLAHTTIVELPNEAISVAKTLDIIKDDFCEMLELAFDIRREADTQGDVTLVAKLEDHIAAYQKNLWFIKAIQAKSE